MKQMKDAVFGALLGAIVAGCGSWLAFGMDKVSRDELTRHVAERSPWVIERGEVQSSLRASAARLGELDARIAQLLEAQIQLTIEVKLLAQKVDRLLEATR